MNLWKWLRKLPVARYLRPVWQFALKEIIVQAGGDEIQKIVAAELARGLSGAMERINPKLEATQRKAKGAIMALPLPAGIEKRACDMFDDGIDSLREKLNLAINAGSYGAVLVAVNRAFDDFQSLLKARIDAL